MRVSQIFWTLHGLVLAAVIASACLSTGCSSSVYHRAGAALPGELDDRLALRVREARNAADIAMGIIDAQGPITPQRTEKADAAAWEYSRRVASVQDIMRRLPEPDFEAQQVLASLEKAESELNVAIERLTAAEPAGEEALVAAKSSLSSAMETADLFTDGRASAAMLPAKGPNR
jgi:hypothetical protein